MTWEVAADAVIAGFQNALSITMDQQNPIESELLRTEELVEEKYKTDKWTHRLP